MERYILDYMIETFEKHSISYENEKKEHPEISYGKFNMPNALKSICLELKEIKDWTDSHMDEFTGGH